MPASFLLMSGMSERDLNRNFIGEIEKLPSYAYYAERKREIGRNPYEGTYDYGSFLMNAASTLNDYVYNVKEAIKIQNFLSKAEIMSSTYANDKHFIQSAFSINGNQLTVSPSQGKYNRGLSPITIDVSMGSNDTTPEATLYRKLVNSGTDTGYSSSPFGAIVYKMDPRQALNINWPAMTGLTPKLSIFVKRARDVNQDTFNQYNRFIAQLNEAWRKAGSPVMPGYRATSSTTSYADQPISEGVDEFSAIVGGANTSPIAGTRKTKPLAAQKAFKPPKNKPIPQLKKRR